jgi:hypothetical protein
MSYKVETRGFKSKYENRGICASVDDVFLQHQGIETDFFNTIDGIDDFGNNVSPDCIFLYIDNEQVEIRGLGITAGNDIILQGYTVDEQEERFYLVDTINDEIKLFEGY